jgi:hypothetical protein
MGVYRVAEVCPSGHVSTDAADASPELREKFCSRCGEATMMACPGCKADIRGDYYVEGFFGVGHEYKPPAHCHNCGASFPWTERKVAAAVELLEVGANLSPEEAQLFGADLTELTKDSPKTQVASLRVKRVLTKVGGSLASGVRDIVVDVLSEAAKKIIWSN